MKASRRRLWCVALATSWCARCAPVDDTTGRAVDAIVVCARGATVEGVDVSEWQGGSIDWGAVHASGREFAITRVGDGLYRDPTFARNWAGIRAAGMIRGAYQFFRANRDAVAQANIVCEVVGRLGPGDLPAMIDVEADNGVSPAGIRAGIDAWIGRVRECTGKTPLIYSAGWFWNPHVGSADHGGYPLVVAAYGPRCPDLPLGWSDWFMFQYSDGEERYTPGVGAVPGIGQSVDRDRFNGTLDELRRFVDGNRPPVGYLDHAGCDALSGWSMDPDRPDTVIDVHLYINGPAGSGAPGFAVHAGTHRDDLCAAIGSCNHGYALATPAAFLDGAEHSVYAYGIDAMGGDNPLLGTATFRCAPPTPPLGPERGVRRHVPDPAALAAWRWTGADIAHLSDATLDAFPSGPDVVAAPALTRGDGEDAVYVVENRTLRHVPDPDAMTAWRLSFDEVRVAPPATVHANLEGAALLGRPFLAQGSGAAVYLIDQPPPLWAEVQRVDAPTSLAPGASGAMTLTVRNRGAIAWNPGAVWLVPVQPREHDSALCDRATWRSCREAATVGAAVAPGATATFTVTLRAPTQGGVTRECFALRQGGFYFSDPGQMGFADDAVCRAITVTTSPVTDAGVVRDAGVVNDVAEVDTGELIFGPDAAVGDGDLVAPTMPTGGCGCRASTRGTQGVAWWAAGSAAMVAARRRRRARRG